MFFNKKTLKKTDHVYKFGSEGYFSHWKPVTDFGVALGPPAGYFELVKIGGYCKNCGLVEGAYCQKQFGWMRA